MRINVRFDVDAALQRLERIAKDTQEKAIAAAVNKTIDKARAEMTRQITGVYNIKAKDVRAQMSVTRASRKAGVFSAQLEAFGRRRGHRSRNVMLFDARPVKGRGASKRVHVRMPDGAWRTLMIREGGGVSIKIKKGGARKVIPGAFIGNKGRTVFQRLSSGRLPIKAVETIDVPQMFNTRRLMDAVVTKARADFLEEFDRAIKLYVRT